MVKKDPHADESTAELDPVTYQDYMNARDAVMSWTAEAERLKALLDQQLGDAYAGTINGRKLVTHRPESRYRVSQLERDYPELTQHYLKERLVTELDMDTFAKVHPEIAEQYRTRSFRTLADL